MKAVGDTLIRGSKNVLIFFFVAVHLLVFLDVPNVLKKLKLLIHNIRNGPE